MSRLNAHLGSTKAEYDGKFAEINNAQGGRYNVLEAVAIQAAPSIFMTLTTKLGNHLNSQSEDAEEGLTAKEMQDRLDSILKNNKVSSVDGLSVNLETKKMTLDNLTTQLTSIEQNQVKLQYELQMLKSLNNDDPAIKLNPNRITEIETELKKIEELKTQKATLEKEIAALENDIKNAKSLVKSIKKAEGKDVIENMLNENTGSIASLLKKSNKAREKGDHEKAKKLNLELYNKLEEYYKAPDAFGKNPSIDRLYKAKFGDPFGVIKKGTV